MLLGDPQAVEPWDDPEVWEMIASGGARAVHHIESPAMISLCRMSNVREIDGLIAIVSVIRPGAANEDKETFLHPALSRNGADRISASVTGACLQSTFGLVVYEEHILQICEALPACDPGRADVLRRALMKQKRAVIEEIEGNFLRRARARHADGENSRGLGSGHRL